MHSDELSVIRELWGGRDGLNCQLVADQCSGIEGVRTIVAVADSNNIHDRDVFNMAGDFCVSFWAHKTEWAASLLKNGVEQNTEAAWEFDIITCVS